jgi:hypothetical protein
MGAFAGILATEGEEVTWCKREEHEASESTGDLEVGEVFEPTTIKAIIRNVKADDLQLDPGCSVNDQRRIYTTTLLGQKDRVIYQGSSFEVGPPQIFRFRGAIEYVTAILRKREASVVLPEGVGFEWGFEWVSEGAKFEDGFERT